MEIVTGIIAWVQAHWVDIAAIYAGIVTVASLIVKLTPTLKDDTVLLAIIKWVAKYLALNTNAPTSRPA
jgi:hypothetical protein